MRLILLVLLVALLGAGECRDQRSGTPSSKGGDSTRTRFTQHDTTMIDSPIPRQGSR
ncbi:MAG TPA: hypothetical protein VFQ05_06765 [Candidatus Eisenbacteria bacterium]|nr:hypothetical protein [Candidatus Eisenbacteria bacterium]